MASRKKPKKKLGKAEKEKKPSPFLSPAAPEASASLPPDPAAVQGMHLGNMDVPPPPKVQAKSQYDIQREKDRVEESLRSIESLEKMHAHYVEQLSKVQDALKEAAKAAIGLESKCTTSSINRELHMSRRMRTRDLVLLPMALSNHIAKFIKRTSVQIALGLESAREDVDRPLGSESAFDTPFARHGIRTHG